MTIRRWSTGPDFSRITVVALTPMPVSGRTPLFIRQSTDTPQEAELKRRAIIKERLGLIHVSEVLAN